jgi:hypothetical protein
MNLFTKQRKVRFNIPNETKIKKNINKNNHKNKIINSLKNIKKFYYYINKKFDHFTYIIFCI